MTDRDYSKREIDIQFEALKQHLNDVIKPVCEKTDRILEQTTKTNGRVSALERWRSYLAGAIAILSSIVLPVVWILIKNHL